MYLDTLQTDRSSTNAEMRSEIESKCFIFLWEPGTNEKHSRTRWPKFKSPGARFAPSPSNLRSCSNVNKLERSKDSQAVLMKASLAVVTPVVVGLSFSSFYNKWSWSFNFSWFWHVSCSIFLTRVINFGYITNIWLDVFTLVCLFILPPRHMSSMVSFPS